MASDQLRKKWGTIFMGEREASPQQLDAMQEPLLRERAQQQHQEDYLARVRARAEERAREILGAAYAERQKVLEEAGAEAQARIQQLTREAQALRAQAQDEFDKAQAEHAKAHDLREEAEIIRDNAHNNGFQAGMAQAGAELKEFRADVGQMLGNMLQALEAQRHALGMAWRDELAELARVAVEAGTGWLLQAEHGRILQHLVFSSLQLLEDRATVSVRVHPDDEETVGDLFRAARERVPELNQWIVNGDASIEPGGLVAESVSGSVENLRAHYREMVNNILEHLTLPPRPQDDQAEQAAGAVAAQGLAHLAEILPQAEAPAAEVPATLPPDAELEPETEFEPDMPAAMAQDSASDLVQNLPPDHAGEAEPNALEPNTLEPAAAIAVGMTPDEHGELADMDVQAAHDTLADAAQPQQMAQPETLAEQIVDGAPLPPQGNASMPDDVSANVPNFANEQNFANDHAGAAELTAVPAGEAAHQQTHNVQAANPSLAELEDELFPLPAEEEDHYAQPHSTLAHSTQANSAQLDSAQPEPAQADSSVFVSGGFLPGSGNG